MQANALQALELADIRQTRKTSAFMTSSSLWADQIDSANILKIEKSTIHSLEWLLSDECALSLHSFLQAHLRHLPLHLLPIIRQNQAFPPHFDTAANEESSDLQSHKNKQEQHIRHNIAGLGLFPNDLFETRANICVQSPIDELQ